MNRIFNTRSVFFILVLGAITSCNWIDPDINVHPDRPAEVPMDLLLPSVQARMGFTIAGGNDMVLFTSIWIQYLSNIGRGSGISSTYEISPQWINNLWREVYAGALMDAKQIIIQATAEGNESPHFEGVAKICQAVILGYATDVWGNIPWSEALQGGENLQPKFDEQADVYKTIQRLLDEGITRLNMDAGAFQLSGDIIYGGDIDKWKSAAYALKARYALHLVKRDQAAYTKALDHLKNAFTSNGGNMKYYYSSSSDLNTNPFYLYMYTRGDVRMCSTLIDSLKKYKDPRLPVFAMPIKDKLILNGVVYLPGDYVGAPPGTPVDAVSEPGPGFSSPDSPTPIITAAEVHFIRAECLTMTGSYAAARDAFKEAVKASLEEYDVFDESWFLSYSAIIDLVPDNLLLQKIINDKWKSLTYNFEAYNDWRRTGWPVLVPNPNEYIGEIPRRFPYAQDAISYNQNTPDLGPEPMLSRVWWDVNR